MRNLKFDDVACAEPSAESKTIIVRNLSYDTGEDDIKDAFDGAVNCRLMTHPDTGKSKGSVLRLMFNDITVKYGQ